MTAMKYAHKDSPFQSLRFTIVNLVFGVVKLTELQAQLLGGLFSLSWFPDWQR